MDQDDQDDANISHLTADVGSALDEGHTDARVLETADDIRVRREQVLNRFNQFKESAKERRSKLEQSRLYQYFRRDIDELIQFMESKIHLISSEKLSKDLVEINNRLQKHESFVADIMARERSIHHLEGIAEDMLSGEHYAKNQIKSALDQIHDLWYILLKKLDERVNRLRLAAQLAQFRGDSDNLLMWMREKEAFIVAEEICVDLEQVRALQKKYEEFQRELAGHENEVAELNKRADTLIGEGHPESNEIIRRQRDLNDSWQRLKQLSIRRQERLFGVHEMQRLARDINDTLEWVREWYDMVQSEGWGTDIASVHALQRKHDAFIRELDAIKEKVNILMTDADRLTQAAESHEVSELRASIISEDPGESNEVQLVRNARNNLCSAWDELLYLVQSRKHRLSVLAKSQSFLADYGDLTNWYADRIDIIAVKDTAEHVSGAEALFESHYEHKGEIDAREENYKSLVERGNELQTLDGPNELSEENRAQLKQKIMNLENQRNELLESWSEKFATISQLLDYQLFVRDLQQLSKQMSKQHVFLGAFDEEVDSSDDVEAMIRKYDDFEKSLMAQESKAKTLDHVAEMLIDNNNFNAAEVVRHRDQLRFLRSDLSQRMASRRSALSEMQRVFNFERDCDDLHCWAVDKLKIAASQDYLDPTNLSNKNQKHMQFVNEVQGAQPRLQSLISAAHELIEEVGLKDESADRIRHQIDNLNGLLTRLRKLTEFKSDRLRDALSAQQFIRESEQLLMWFEESSNQLKRVEDDLGKDVASVQALRKRHQELESELAVKKERLEALSQQAEKFERESHFESSNLLRRHCNLVDHMNAFLEPVKNRREKLELSLQFYKLMSDLDDEDNWIKEKEPLIMSGNRGRDLIGVQNLCRRHQALLFEIASHEARIREVCNTAEDMINQKHYAAGEVKHRLIDLQGRWHQMKDRADLRRRILDCSLQTQRYFADAAEAESWMKEKVPRLSSSEYGRDEDIAYSLNKKHKQLTSDIEFFGDSTLKELRERVPICQENELEVQKQVEGVWRDQYVCAIEGYTERSPREISMRQGELLLLLNSSHQDWWKVELNDRQGFVPSSLLKKVEPGSLEKTTDPIPQMISLRQADLDALYADLIKMCTVRQVKLDETLDAFRIIREASELIIWIGRKESEDKLESAAPRENNLAGIEDVDELQRRFEDFKKELKANEHRVLELNRIAEKLLAVGGRDTDAARRIEEDMAKLNACWERLKNEAVDREAFLMNAHEVQRYHRNTDEAFDWLQDKVASLEEVVAEITTGQLILEDLPNIKRMQRKHEAFERDLNALSDRVRELDEMAGRLMEQHPEQAHEIYEKQSEIQKTWAILTARADEKKAHLMDAYDYSRFASEFDDLLAWLKNMTDRVADCELAQDVPGAEALLERHHEHRTEIDARASPFQLFENFGQELIKADHYAQDNVQEKLDGLATARDQLESAWKERQEILDQCLELQLFNRDCDSADQWMESRERAVYQQDELDSSGISGGVEAAIKRHEDLDRALAAQQDKIRLLSQFAEQLVNQNHYDSNVIQCRLSRVMGRWETLRSFLVEQKARLCESQTLQDFSRDADEIEAWIAERLAIATQTALASVDGTGGSTTDDATVHDDQSSLVRLPLQSRTQRQQVFEAELAANAERVNAVVQMGRSLIDARKCSGIEAQVDARLSEIIEQWEFLVKKTNDKTLRIQESSRQQAFNAAVKDLEFWLSEMERSLVSEDIGKDVNSVNLLIKKHALIEADVSVHGQAVDDLCDMANKLRVGRIEDTASLDVSEVIKDRYAKVKQMSEKRHKALSESSLLHQFVRDLEEMDTQISEKLMYIETTETIRDLEMAQKCRNKHKRLGNELEHRLLPAVERNCELGQSLLNTCKDMAGGAALFEDLSARVASLSKAWDNLTAKTQERARKLNDSMDYFNWHTMFSEECMWLKKKQKDFQQSKLSDSATCVRGMLKQHDEARQFELVVHKKRCDDVCKNGRLLQENNRHAEAIAENIGTLCELIKTVDDAFEARHTRILKNFAYVQFLWKTEVVENWIADRVMQLDAMKDDIGHELSVVHNLLDRHDTFDAGLDAFEGIRLLEKLNFELPVADEDMDEFLKLANARYARVKEAWETLRSKSRGRRQKLENIACGFTEMDDLFLQFARKASAFNSWFENAEEDLSDPVNCQSFEEIQALIAGQEDFKKSLTGVKQEFDEIMELDKKIKALGLGNNPYTWFTIETLIDTWHSLEKALAERDVSLKNELEKQEKNCDMCMKFAERGNNFHAALSKLRMSLAEQDGSDSLDAQMKQLQIAQAELTGPFKIELESIELMDSDLQLRRVRENPYALYSAMDLSQLWQQVHTVICSMIRNIQQQCNAMQDCGVNEQYLKECTMMFRHFDKERTGRFTHEDFSNCLQALGYDMSKVDPNTSPASRIEANIRLNRYLNQVDYERTGYVTMNAFTSFMISQETEQIQSVHELVEAFKILTEHGHRPYITKEELEKNLSPVVCDYCVRKMPSYVDAHNREVNDAYDYEKFIYTFFNRRGQMTNGVSHSTEPLSGNGQVPPQGINDLTTDNGVLMTHCVNGSN